MTLSFKVHHARRQRAMRQSPFHTWQVNQDQTVWCEFRRLPNEVHLRFPDLADFIVAADGSRVDVVPDPALDETTLEHLYLNQVLPLVFSAQGLPVFHGSAVDIGGSAAAFIGESGRGKSTLATYLVLHGGRLIADDGLVLETTKDDFDVRPSHPSVRLWDDSREALVGTWLDTAPPVSYTNKARLLAGSALPRCEVPVPLCRAYFLGTGEVDDVKITPMSAAEAAVEWVKHSFLLDIKERLRLASHFGQVGKLAALGIAYRLDYPRDFDLLPNVRAALLAHIGQ